MALEDSKAALEVYGIIHEAIPEGANMLAVMRACEIIIADCISQAKSDPETDERTYKAIADDIRNMTESFRSVDRSMTKEDEV